MSLNIIAILLSIFLCSLYFIWRKSLHFSSWIGANPYGTRVSWMLLFLWLISKSLVFSLRDDPAALFIHGFTAQNYLQAAVISTINFWVMLLIILKKISFKSYIVGARIWISLQIVLYFLSVFWSIIPELSFYRLLELFVIWSLLIHIFTSSPNASLNFKRYLLLSISSVIGGTLFYTLYYNFEISTTIFAFLRSNTGGALAGIALIYLLSDIDNYSFYNYLKYFIFIVFSLLLFGSLASFVALLASLPILYILNIQTKIKKNAMMLFSFVLIIAGLYFINSIDLGDLFISSISQIVKKTPQNFLNLTGRLPLWEAIWYETNSYPFGQGFAMDRYITSQLLSLQSVGWRASHAHSGYISAWISAGWPGVVLLLIAFVSIWHYTIFFSGKRRAWFRSTIIFLVIININIVGIGGYMNPIWGILMVLTLFIGDNYEVVHGS